MAEVTPEQRAEWADQARFRPMDIHPHTARYRVSRLITALDAAEARAEEFAEIAQEMEGNWHDAAGALARVEAVLAAEEARVERANAQFEAEGRFNWVTGRPFRISTIVGAEELRNAIAGVDS